MYTRGIKKVVISVPVLLDTIRYILHIVSVLSDLISIARRGWRDARYMPSVIITSGEGKIDIRQLLHGFYIVFYYSGEIF